MTTFEYVFALYSIMTSIALGVLVSGVVRLIRDGRVRKLDTVGWLWIWIAFGMVVGNWGAFWGLRTLEEWTAPFVLVNLALTLVQYALCEFVVPDPVRADEAPSVAAADRRRAVWSLLILTFVAIAGNLTTMTFYDGWMRDTIFSIGIGLIAVMLLITRKRWLEIGGTALIALSTVHFLWIATAILAQ